MLIYREWKYHDGYWQQEVALHESLPPFVVLRAVLNGRNGRVEYEAVVRECQVDRRMIISTSSDHFNKLEDAQNECHRLLSKLLQTHHTEALESTLKCIAAKAEDGSVPPSNRLKQIVAIARSATATEPQPEEDGERWDGQS